MIYIILSVLVALFVFSCYMAVYGDEKKREFEQKLKILEKLIESIQDKLDLHKL